MPTPRPQFRDARQLIAVLPAAPENGVPSAKLRMHARNGLESLVERGGRMPVVARAGIALPAMSGQVITFSG